MSLLTGAATIAALFPLFSVLYLLVRRGIAGLEPDGALRELPPAAMAAGGGFGNAIVGTLVIVAIATLISVPFGILAAIYIAEFGPDTRTASGGAFRAKVLTGLPSILAGVFAFAVVVVVTGEFLRARRRRRAGAADAADGPADRRGSDQAGARRGCAKRRSEWARRRRRWCPSRACRPPCPAILTGVMLAVARGRGRNRAAALHRAVQRLLDEPHGARISCPRRMGDLMKPTASLAVMIYNFSGSPFENQIELAWAAALVLVAIVLVFNVRWPGSGRAIRRLAD